MKSLINKFRKDVISEPQTNNNARRSIVDSLDYFSHQGVLSRTIVDEQRRVIHSMGDRVGSVSSLDFDVEMNKDLIRDSALTKYGTGERDLSLTSTTWFPRVRNKTRHANRTMDDYNDGIDDDNESVNSDDSDFSQDGFAGPFSWETKSLQEMVFPATPLGERKLIALHNKINDNNNNVNTIFVTNTKKSHKKVSMATDEKNKLTHRSYETIDELRMRLLKNYKEAKKQREKYLNINKAKTNPESCINGYRFKPNQQPVFKNYKLKSGDDENTLKPRDINGGAVVTFAIVGQDHQPTSSKCKKNISFAEELSDAIQKQSEVVLPTLTSTSGVDSDSSSDSVKVFNNSTICNNVQVTKASTPPITKTTAAPTTTASPTPLTIATMTSQTSRYLSGKESVPISPLRTVSFTPPEVASRTVMAPPPTKSSMKNILKRSDSKTEKSDKRKNSVKKSVDRAEVTQKDVDNVLANQHSRDSLYQNDDPSDNGLDNVMDMLANW